MAVQTVTMQELNQLSYKDLALENARLRGLQTARDEELAHKDELLADKDRTIIRLQDTIRQKDDRIRELERAFNKEQTRNFRQKLEIQELRKITKNQLKLLEADEDKISHLRSVLNNNSRNTSLPPSSDQKKTSRVRKDSKPDKDKSSEEKDKAANEFNGRQKTGTKVGGQPGHPGTTLSVEDAEALLHSPGVISVVKTIGEPGHGEPIKRFLLDGVLVPKVTELITYPDADGKYPLPPELQRSSVAYGDMIKALTVYLYARGRMSIQEISNLFSMATEGRIAPSQGTLYRFLETFSKYAKETIRVLEADLSPNTVLQTDATNINMGAQQVHIRVVSDPGTSIYYPMKSKTYEELSKISPLKAALYVIVHDHEMALYKFEKAEHAECNVHVLRYLRKSTEDTGNQWEQQFADLLLKANEETKKQGGSIPDAAEREAYRKQALEILHRGYEENAKVKSESARKIERRLLNRLSKFLNEHLLFMTDKNIPFDNNLCERDLRGPKLKAKNSGGLREFSGVEVLSDILTIIETSRKRGLPILPTLMKIFQSHGEPVSLEPENKE